MFPSLFFFSHYFTSSSSGRLGWISSESDVLISQRIKIYCRPRSRLIFIIYFLRDVCVERSVCELAQAHVYSFLFDFGCGSCYHVSAACLCAKDDDDTKYHDISRFWRHKLGIIWSGTQHNTNTHTHTAAAIFSNKQLMNNEPHNYLHILVVASKINDFRHFFAAAKHTRNVTYNNIHSIYMYIKKI